MAEIVTGTGAAVPDYVLDNAGVTEMVDTEDTWIRERTGIFQRHIAKEETTAWIAAEAAYRAVADAGIAPHRIDLIVVATAMAGMRMQQMLADGVDTFVEIGVGKTLAGFLRKLDRNVNVYPVTTWEEAQDVIAKLGEKKEKRKADCEYPL